MDGKNEVKARYTTRKTAVLHGLDIRAYEEEMREYGLKLQLHPDRIDVIDTDTESLTHGETVDVASFILLFDPSTGDWVGELLNSEMCNTFTLADGRWLTSEELEVPGWPPHIAKALRESDRKNVGRA